MKHPDPYEIQELNPSQHQSGQDLDLLFFLFITALPLLFWRMALI
jgi:hypothetical protein